MSLLRLVLLVALVLAVVWAFRSYRLSRGVRFTPVEELAPEVRHSIDAALARGEVGEAMKHYRAATGAGLAESKAAVETRRWKKDA